MHTIEADSTTQFECYSTHKIGQWAYLTPKHLEPERKKLGEKEFRKKKKKGHSLIQWWSGIILTSKQKRTFHSPVS